MCQKACCLICKNRKTFMISIVWELYVCFLNKIPSTRQFPIELHRYSRNNTCFIPCWDFMSIIQASLIHRPMLPRNVSLLIYRIGKPYSLPHPVRAWAIDLFLETNFLAKFQLTFYYWITVKLNYKRKIC